MPIKTASRVKEIASNKPDASTAFNLPDSAATGYQSFDSAFATNDVIPYFATNGTEWESGLGTFTAGTPDTLARTTILESSTGSAIDWSAGGDVTVFVEMPAKTAGGLVNLGVVIVRGHATTTQTLSGNVWTKLSAVFSESTDELGWWDATNAIFQPTVAGYYSVTAGAQINTLADGKYMIAAVYKNGAVYAHLARGYASAASAIVGVSGTTLVYMNGSSDYIEVYAYQSDSTTRDTFAGAERQFFSAFKVKGTL